MKDNAKNFASEMQHGHCQLGFALGNLQLRRAGKAREERPQHGCCSVSGSIKYCLAPIRVENCSYLNGKNDQYSEMYALSTK